MYKVGIIGSLGVGKTSFIKRLQTLIKEKNKTIHIYGEPSMVDPSINKILLKFYNNQKTWAYPLELAITAAYETIYTEIKELEQNSELDVVIVDTPSSPYIYSKIFLKNQIFSLTQQKQVSQIFTDFNFDYIIVLQETAEETIRRIFRRHRDMELSNFNYIKQHVEDYKQFLKEYISVRFGNAKVIILSHLPDLDDPKYHTIIENIYQLIINGG
jgi:deoxyadenosine/deoxycytidine kinase